MHKLGIIGFGGMAGNHYKALRGNERIAIKGIYDINPERGEYAKTLGLVSYESKEALLNDPEIDVVLVATTNDFHKSLSIEALRAGKHVMCEKPVTTKGSDLEDIMKVAKECGKIFSVDQNRRVNKDFILMRRQVESGILGDVYHIESRVEGSRGMPEGWRTQKAQGGGMMYDWGVHLIDQIMYMYDCKVTNVYCKMYSIHYPEVDDNFRLYLTLENGVTAQIEVSTNNFILHPRWYVLGSDATLQIDDWACEGRIVKEKEKANTWDTEIVVTKAGPSKTMAPRDPSTVEIIPLSAPEDVVDNLTPIYDWFLDAVEGKAELKIKPEQALRVIKVMEAAFESARTGEAIKTDI